MSSAVEVNDESGCDRAEGEGVLAGSAEGRGREGLTHTRCQARVAGEDGKMRSSTVVRDKRMRVERALGLVVVARADIKVWLGFGVDLG